MKSISLIIMQNRVFPSFSDFEQVILLFVVSLNSHENGHKNTLDSDVT